MLWYLGPRKQSSPSPTQVMQAFCAKFGLPGCNLPLFTCTVRVCCYGVWQSRSVGRVMHACVMWMLCRINALQLQRVSPAAPMLCACTAGSQC